MQQEISFRELYQLKQYKIILKGSFFKNFIETSMLVEIEQQNRVLTIKGNKQEPNYNIFNSNFYNYRHA